MKKYFFILISLLLITGCTKNLRPRVAELESELDAEKKLVQTLKTEIIEVESKLKKSESDYIALLDSSQKESEIQRQKIASLIKDKVRLQEDVNNLDEKASRLNRQKISAETDLKIQLSEYNSNKAIVNAKSTLTVQLGLTMKSGDTKPIVNTKVYLSKSSAATLLQGVARINNDGKTMDADASGIIYTIWANGNGKWSSSYSNFADHANASASALSFAVSDTDFNGVVTFEDIPKGIYYVICVTPLGGGAALEKKITISAEKMKIALSNADSL